MKKRILFSGLCRVLLVITIVLGLFAVAKAQQSPPSYEEIGKQVQKLMAEGDIPGLSLAIVQADREPFLQGFGYADVERKVPVTPATLFELASCSKAFTGLAALRCESDGLINLDDPVSKYFPGFYGVYKGKKYDQITLRQLLQQISGIPFKSVSLIVESDAPDALQATVKNLFGVELSSVPGTNFEYATVNYDVVGAVIEKASGLSYEAYMMKNVITPLGLGKTMVGVDKANRPPDKATGYKIGFFKARQYDAPVFRGNNPAGYIISNGQDMARWLQVQMGLVETDLKPLVERSHQTDEQMLFNPTTLTGYNLGWFLYAERQKRIDHNGLNPNFTSFVAFNPKDRIGVVVLSNSNSNYTTFIANSVMSYLHGKGFLKPSGLGDNIDKGSSVISFMLAFFLLVVFFYILSIILGVLKGKRKFARPGFWELGKLALVLVVYVPFLVGIYLTPRTLAGVSMDTALVFSAVSFQVALMLVVSAMALCFLAMVLSTFFPQKNKYLRDMPLLLLLSIMSGGANAIVIFLITTSIFNTGGLFYQLYNFTLAFFVYILGRKVLQTRLTRMTFDIVYDMRTQLLDKVFYTSYQKFEKIDRGRVFATLNNDTAQIAGSAGILVQLVTSVITTIAAFLYLATIAFWATLLTIVLVAVIATVYSLVTSRTQKFFEEARETQNTFMGQLNGLIDGFKELSLQYNKKMEYRKELSDNVDEFRQKQSTALIKFINAFLVGESLLIIVLGSVGFGIPRLFPSVTAMTLMGFVMVLLYLIGPINGILNSVPAIAQLKVAWGRVSSFIKDIPANMDPKEIDALDHTKPGTVNRIEARGLSYTYEAENESERFSVGPLDFEANKGEIVFIIGGNGSGKTTLVKLLTGLYLPQEGTIKIDGQETNNYQLGEYFSVVFGDYHLFQKLYNVDLTGKEEEIQAYLQLLRLEDKVSLQGNAFSTIGLSGGQRKRLALLQCYLEDCPIYLFDEIAADQDPEFRKFFYRELLPKMKEKGKIVIAVTHDDHYFDVADKVIKMDMGKIDILEEGAARGVTR